MDSESRQRSNFDDFEEAMRIAWGLYSDVELAFWLTAPQPLLGMFTPVQLFAKGDAQPQPQSLLNQEKPK